MHRPQHSTTFIVYPNLAFLIIGRHGALTLEIGCSDFIVVEKWVKQEGRCSYRVRVCVRRAGGGNGLVEFVVECVL